MRALLIALCCCLCLGAVCRAQQADQPPILLVYVGEDDVGDSSVPSSILPRIALGVEQPTLKIIALEKCTTVWTGTGAQNGIAVQLKPEDAKILSAALWSNSHTTLRPIRIWFATPDNKVLDSLKAPSIERNLTKHGIIAFYPGLQPSIINYLAEKLKPK
jgi:hypothetical protein